MGAAGGARTDSVKPGADLGVSIKPQPANLDERRGGSATQNGAAVVKLTAAPTAGSDAEQLAAAYAWCAKLARSHYENFTIASWLMPRAMRRHVHAIYAYARIADDFADEERSIAQLDRWQHELELAYAGAPRHPVMVALADTAHRYDIPPEPFLDLLKAFRSDVEFQGFETAADLLGYARYSANPVGSPCALSFRLPRCGTAAALGFNLYRAAACEFLAGCRNRFGQGTNLFSAP